MGTQVLDDQIDAVRRRALDRMDSATTVEELEAVRIEALGRKGFLANASKDFGKLAPEDRARAGKLLNAAKQEIEAALEQRRAFARPRPCSAGSTRSGWT